MTEDEERQQLDNLKARKRHGMRAEKRPSGGIRVNYKESTKHRIAMILRISGYEYSQIALIVNATTESVKHWFTAKQYVEFQEEYNILKASVTKAAAKLLEAYTIEAIQAIAHVMRTTYSDELVLKAAAEILDRAGMPKTSRQEKKSDHEHHHEITAGGESLLEKLRDAPPEIQEQAAKGIEEIEKLLATAPVPQQEKTEAKE